MNMMIVAQRTPDQIYLVRTSPMSVKDANALAFVADLDTGFCGEEHQLLSIAARGYWEAFKGDQKLILSEIEKIDASSS